MSPAGERFFARVEADAEQIDDLLLSEPGEPAGK